MARGPLHQLFSQRRRESPRRADLSAAQHRILAEKCRDWQGGTERPVAKQNARTAGEFRTWWAGCTTLAVSRVCAVSFRSQVPVVPTLAY